jgi:site-specific DNA-methyltransferase (adenine-specific)
MRPYYEKNGITLYLGDCREILPSLSVDMIFTDPPYGVNYSGGHFHTKDLVKRPREKLINDDQFVFDWFMPLAFSACKGPCYIFAAAQSLLSILSAIKAERGTFYNILVWNKPNATYAALNAQYKQRHELLVYCKGKAAKSYWVGSTKERSVWDIPKDPSNPFHPTQKPVALGLKAIGNHAVDLICDPFCGAGSTLLAAMHLGRKAIGIEINEDYCERAAKRLDSCAENGTPDP